MTEFAHSHNAHASQNMRPSQLVKFDSNNLFPHMLESCLYFEALQFIVVHPFHMTPVIGALGCTIVVYTPSI